MDLAYPKLDCVGFVTVAESSLDFRRCWAIPIADGIVIPVASWPRLKLWQIEKAILSHNTSHKIFSWVCITNHDQRGFQNEAHP